MMGHYDDAYAEEEKAGGKTSTWFEKMHTAAKDSPEYKACMEELIKEEKILSELRGFIMIGTDNGAACLNVNLIASVYQDDRAARCMVTVNSGEAFWSTETLIEVAKKINKARSAYRGSTEFIKTCPECQQNADSGMNFCAFCGRQLWDNCLKSEPEPK